MYVRHVLSLFAHQEGIAAHPASMCPDYLGYTGTVFVREHPRIYLSSTRICGRSNAISVREIVRVALLASVLCLVSYHRQITSSADLLQLFFCVAKPSHQCPDCSSRTKVGQFLSETCIALVFLCSCLTSTNLCSRPIIRIRFWSFLSLVHQLVMVLRNANAHMHSLLLTETGETSLWQACNNYAILEFHSSSSLDLEAWMLREMALLLCMLIP